MARGITIIGGNIAGLSAAYHLAQKGCRVTVYEKKIWDKPCGGAISAQFAGYLKNHVGIRLNAASEPILPIRCGFQSTQWVLIQGVFVVTSRYQLQNALMAKLFAHPNVDIVFKQVGVAVRLAPGGILQPGAKQN